MTQVRRSGSRTKRFDAWVGTATEIERLEAVLDADLAPRRSAALRTLEQKHSEEIESYKGLGLPVDSLSERHSKDRSEIETVGVDATAEEKSDDTDELSGSVSAVLEESDLRSLQSLRLTMGKSFRMPGDYSASITLDREDGIRFYLTGEPRWRRSMAADLEAEIKRGVPWWHILRNYSWGLALGIAIGILATISYAALTPGDPATSLALTLMSPVLWLPILLRRILPGFEVITAGATPTGSRRLRRIGYSVVVIAGLVLSALSFVSDGGTVASTSTTLS